MAKSFSPDTAGTLATGLVAGYTFEADSSDQVDSHSGTDTGITYSAGNGKVGNGAGFDGSTSRIDLASAFSLGDASYSLWVKTSTDGRIIVGEQDTASGSGWVLRVHVGIPTTHKPTFQLINFGVGGSTAVTGSTSIDDGNWHHIVGIRSGSTYTIYVDGNLDGTTTSGNTTSTNSLVTLGGELYGSVLYTPLNGSLDEVYVWSKALSSTEIADLYNSGSGNTYIERGGTPQLTLLGVG